MSGKEPYQYRAYYLCVWDQSYQGWWKTHELIQDSRTVPVEVIIVVLEDKKGNDLNNRSVSERRCREKTAESKTEN